MMESLKKNDGVQEFVMTQEVEKIEGLRTVESVLNVMSTRLMSSVYKRNCHKSIIHNHQLCLDKEASWIPSHTFQGNSHE